MSPFISSLDTSYLDVILYGITRGAAGLAALAAGSIATLVIIIVPVQLHRISLAPKNVPWVGQSKYTWFAKLRSTLVALKYERSNLEEGWEKYSSKGQPFVRPSLHWPSVVLPPCDADWLAHQPEHIIAAAKVQDEVLGLEWLASGPSNAFIHDFTVIRRDLTRQVNNCIPDVLDEIRHTFDAHFAKGEDAEEGWKNVVINDAIRKAVCGVANRIIIGLPVCRSDVYFHAVQKWWICFGLTGLVFRSFIPKPLQRLIMPVLSLPTLYWRRRIVRMIEPEVARRVRDLQDSGVRGDGFETRKESIRPNDLMQWLIEQSARSNDPAEMDPRHLSNKLVLFNLFATHTLTTTFTTLLTILLTQTSEDTLTELRTEAANILPKAATDPGLAKQMPLHDSLVRETLRLSPAFDDAMLREVIAPAGVHTPEGIHLPQGSHVAMHTRLMQRSEWSAGDGGSGVAAGGPQDWTEFRPFRFCEMATAEARRQAACERARAVGEEGEGEAVIEAAPATANKGQIGAAQISGKFLGFGLGRHACPGRFFAVSTLKLMLAHLMLEFDVKPFPADRPPQWTEFGGIRLLNEDTYVAMRKRVEKGQSDLV